MYKKIILVFYSLSVFVLLMGQEKLTREQYIELYSGLAMQEMARTGIPASITLAQGCLESDNGNSRLARDAKNHFGIKCHDWEGRKIFHDDDAENECFRKYRSEEESFKDHSEFLTSKSRYAELFTLKPDDYKAWARGLKQAGYATSSKYADMLIVIIEENNLAAFDQLVLAGNIHIPGSGRRHRGEGAEGAHRTYAERKIYSNNAVEYIIIQPGDTPVSLREELQLYPGELYRYNEIGKGFPLDSGMLVYIQPKRNKAEKGNDFHIVGQNEDLREISQIYGVKLKKLMRMNNLQSGITPAPGDKLWLRKRKPIGDEMELKEVESSEEEQEIEMEFDDF